jgi:glycosyltransferase involved in cell wall biosynthesis
MRLVFVDTTLTEAPTGGCQTFLEHLTPALQARHHRVTVITQPGDDAAVAHRLAQTGVRVIDDLWPRRYMPEERARRLADWCRREQIEGYAVSVSRDVGWLSLPLLQPSVQTAAIVHLDGRAFYTPLAYYADYVDHAIGVSQETSRRIRRDCGLPQERTCYIPYGVQRLSEPQLRERAAAVPAPAQFEIAYVGRLVQQQKRVMDIAPLVHELSGRGLQFAMNIIGSGDDAERLRAELIRLRVAHLVRWWGWLAPAEVRRHLCRIDSLILLSDTEGLPLVLLEAMGHGAVPVATRIASGNTEVIVDGENGFLAAVGDLKLFADRLQQLADDAMLRARLQRAAWLTSGGYSVERMASAYEVRFASTGPRAPRPHVSIPVMPSCRSPYPTWLRRIKWRLSARLG